MIQYFATLSPVDHPAGVVAAVAFFHSLQLRICYSASRPSSTLQATKSWDWHPSHSLSSATLECIRLHRKLDWLHHKLDKPIALILPRGSGASGRIGSHRTLHNTSKASDADVNVAALALLKPGACDVTSHPDTQWSCEHAMKLEPREVGSLGATRREGPHLESSRDGSSTSASPLRQGGGGFSIRVLHRPGPMVTVAENWHDSADRNAAAPYLSRLDDGVPQGHGTWVVVIRRHTPQPALCAAAAERAVLGSAAPPWARTSMAAKSGRGREERREVPHSMAISSVRRARVLASLASSLCASRLHVAIIACTRPSSHQRLLKHG